MSRDLGLLASYLISFLKFHLFTFLVRDASEKSKNVIVGEPHATVFRGFSFVSIIFFGVFIREPKNNV